MTSIQTPGMPDRSLATDPKVKEALLALLTDARLAERWAELSPSSLAGHRRILTSFLECGAPPDTKKLSKELLDDLCQRDLVHVQDGKILLAYPFSTKATNFAVTVSYVQLYGVCAIDALGVAALAGRRAQVECLCPICLSSTEIIIMEDGLTIEYSSNLDALVWTGILDVGACAANSQCKSMLLFCSKAHLEAWKHGQPAEFRGYELTLEQAVQLGAAIFHPFLSPAINGAKG